MLIETEGREGRTPLRAGTSRPVGASDIAIRAASSGFQVEIQGLGTIYLSNEELFSLASVVGVWVFMRGEGPAGILPARIGLRTGKSIAPEERYGLSTGR
ncbi:MAG: hypothetical protein HYZ11_15810 [Candidatus Tectomicrobia bacterium]|uniref:Uncharacterized protein n=1 Tax=Tectimicrobiota bacterium TaxID=2528274 RepID=A0A932MPX5_UNCTE|nr:hypothetical protein [Candidatus Tectomicrobia bacterium]